MSSFKPGGIQSIPSDTPRGLRAVLESIIETLQVRTQQRGQALDASPTFRDLMDAGVINIQGGLTVAGKVYSKEQLLGLVSAALPDWVTSDTAPPAPTGLTVLRNTANLVLRWDASTFDQFGHTEVWRATSNNLSNAAFVGSTAGVEFLDRLPGPAETYYYWIRHVSLNGLNFSPFNDVNGASDADVPGTPALTARFAGQFVILEWTTPTSNLAIQYYEIRYGGTAWGVGDTSLGYVSANAARFAVDWVGSRTFRVRAIDINDRAGGAAATSITVVAPGAPSLTTQVVDNNVLLYWTEPVTGTLPIVTYEIRKGATWATAQSVGTKAGLFTTIFETQSGAYTYWIAAIDSAGNFGAPAQATTTVSQPPDYFFKGLWNSTFAGTFSNSIKEIGNVILPINTSETFAQHFTSRSWNTPQDQINAGYPIYAQPAQNSGYYEETIDTGAVLAAMKVTVSANVQTIAGTPVSSITISLSLNGSTWTDYVGVTEVFGTNFRYVKVRVTVTGSGGDDLARILSISTRLDAKLKNDAGMVTCNAGDSGGTQVNFNIPFVDITSITVTANGTTPLIAIYDFTDVPNPTGFKVLLYTTAGARASGTVSWAAKGY